MEVEESKDPNQVGASLLLRQKGSKRAACAHSLAVIPMNRLMALPFISMREIDLGQ